MQTGITQKIMAFFVTIITFFTHLFGLPMKPMGQKLDLTGYEPVFEDEFEGDALDTQAWFCRQQGTGI